MFADPLGDTIVRPAALFKGILSVTGSRELASLIPQNEAGDKMAGVAAGLGSVAYDGIKGVKELVTHPIKTVSGTAHMWGHLRGNLIFIHMHITTIY